MKCECVCVGDGGRGGPVGGAGFCFSLIRVAHLSASTLYQVFSDKATEEEQLAPQAVNNGGC